MNYFLLQVPPMLGGIQYFSVIGMGTICIQIKPLVNQGMVVTASISEALLREFLKKYVLM